MDHTYSPQFSFRFSRGIVALLLCCTLFLVHCAPVPLEKSAASPTSPTPPSTLLPAETGTAFQNGSPAIAYFRTAATDAKPGDTIMLEWESSHGDSAIIQPIMPSGELSLDSIDVSPTGDISYQIPANAHSQQTLTLYVWQTGAESAAVAATLAINVQCQSTWFFVPVPAQCPNLPRTSNAIEQRFEKGVMMWIEEFYWADSPSANNRTIYIFYDNFELQTFTDEWTDAQPLLDPQLIPPPGLYQPTRSIGKIWREDPEIQAQLGWAVAEGKEFATTMQAEKTDQYPHLYIQAYDGSVRGLWPTNYSWKFIPN